MRKVAVVGRVGCGKAGVYEGLPVGGERPFGVASFLKPGGLVAVKERVVAVNGRGDVLRVGFVEVAHLGRAAEFAVGCHGFPDLRNRHAVAGVRSHGVQKACGIIGAPQLKRNRCGRKVRFHRKLRFVKKAPVLPQGLFFIRRAACPVRPEACDVRRCRREGIEFL